MLHNICFEAIQNGEKSEFPRPQQRSVINSEVVEKCKPYEIYRGMYDVHRKAYFSFKNLCK